MRKSYPSDISRETFEKVAPLLSSGRKRTRPREVDLYEVFCALLYVLKSGCQWDMIPRDFPKKSTVYYYFKIWKEQPSAQTPSPLERALKKCGWRGPRQPWAARADLVRDR
jgi:transposase